MIMQKFASAMLRELVRIKVVVFSTENYGHIDFEQSLPERISFLYVTQIHIPHAGLSLRKGFGKGGVCRKSCS